MPAPISVDQHLERILAAVQPLPPYDQPLVEALGLPVCESICRILFDGADARAVVRELMAQPPQAEFD